MKYKHRETGNVYTKDGNYYVLGDSKLPYWVIVTSKDWDEIKQAPKIGTKVKIKNTVSGCICAENKVGIVTDKIACSGLLKEDIYYNNLEIFNIDCSGYVYRVACKDWQEIKEEISVGTKVVDTYSDTKGLTYIKTENGKWKIGCLDNFTISKHSIGEGKRFQIVKEKVKKEWQILSFGNKNYSIIRWKNKYGFFPSEDKNENNRVNEFTEKELLKDDWYYIHSVKYLKTGEIFTIGDKVKHKYSNEIGEILKINLIDDSIFFNTTYLDSNTGTVLFNAVKIKTPLFITSDGKEIFEGDKYYFVVVSELAILDPYVVKTHIADWSNNKTIPLGNKQFSTEAKAEEFVLLNKPVLSINDLNLLSTKPWDMTEIKKFVKSKL